MRILFLGNNRVGLHVLQWLKEQREEIVGLVLHGRSRRKCGEELLEAAALIPSCLFDGSQLRQTEVLNAIRALEADVAVSVYFGYILKREFLALFPRGCMNLHPALLPYNRGAYPNVWSIVDGTPAGVTLHYIDEGVDTGDIIAQRKVVVEPVDTGATLYRKLEEASVQLFVETWPWIKAGTAERTPQPREAGTTHRVEDVRQIDQVDLDRQYTARELIDILRARTFPPYPGAYFVRNGRKVYINVDLRYGDGS